MWIVELERNWISGITEKIVSNWIKVDSGLKVILSSPDARWILPVLAHESLTNHSVNFTCIWWTLVHVLRTSHNLLMVNTLWKWTTPNNRERSSDKIHGLAVLTTHTVVRIRWWKEMITSLTTQNKLAVTFKARYRTIPPRQLTRPNIDVQGTCDHGTGKICLTVKDRN